MLTVREFVEAWPRGPASTPDQGEGRMKFLVKEGFCLGQPRGDVYPGDVVELEPREARPYVATQRLEPITETEPEPAPVPTETQAASVAPAKPPKAPRAPRGS